MTALENAIDAARGSVAASVEIYSNITNITTIDGHGVSSTKMVEHLCINTPYYMTMCPVQNGVLVCDGTSYAITPLGIHSILAWKLLEY